jgi:predicted Fe-Mo cluster-binding NifX family protein
MKVALAVDGTHVAAHFGRCEKYMIAQVDDGAVTEQGTVANPGHEPGYLPRMLNELGVDAIVAGGMGPRAQVLFEHFGIQAIPGVSGPVADVLAQLAAGELKPGESTCEH